VKIFRDQPGEHLVEAGNEDALHLHHLCLSEIKFAHRDDEVRQEMAQAKCDQRHVLLAATARPG
jgi:hypothetical protein